MTHYSAAQRRLKRALPSRLRRRKARSVIDEVAKLSERNGTCLRMSLQDKRVRYRAGVRAKPLRENWSATTRKVYLLR